MSEKVCIGCGIELQCDDPNKSGYLPPEKFNDSHDHYCQRCFKIKNYGQYIPVKLTRDDYREVVQKEMQDAKVAIAVFDIIDFEGSFDDEILDVLREMDSIVVINKLDLIPDQKHPSEVANWVKGRLAEEGIAPLDIAIVSSKNGYGINGIYKKIKFFYPDGVQAMVLGVTNVGKSSIVNRLVGAKTATVSKYPGTTLKSVKRQIPHTNIVLVDTPGLIPEGRISDMVCEKCNLKMVPSNEISRKTFKVAKNRVLIVGQLIWFKVLNDDGIKPIFSLYAAKDVMFHETNVEKMKEFIETEKGNMLNPPCDSCRESYNALEKVKHRLTIKAGQELAIKGLGWISVKRGPLEIELVCPKEAGIVIRPAFIKPKR